jgi:hypothetical protein
MPKQIISEAEIRKIATKYVRSVSFDPNKVPNIKSLISDAFHKLVPNRPVANEDIASVVTHLSKSSLVNDKVIQEAAKKVVAHSAMQDLKHLVGRNIKAIGKKASESEIIQIIKQNKLDPHNSSIQSIRDAVKSYYDPSKPPEDIRDVAKQYAPEITAPEGPQPTQVSRGGQPSAPPPAQKPDIKQGDWIPPKDPRNPTFFEKIRLKLRRYGIKSLTKGARNWLTDNVNKTKKSPNRTRLISQGQTAAEALVGKMFMYFYDAKTKDDLPYWDKFPLIFVVELYDDGWLGLNLHYLPLLLRAKLFDKLLSFANDKSLDKITKLQMSYGLIKNVAQFPEVKPTIKRYLASQVKSELLNVEPVDWEIAVFLPVEQFQKEKKERVWSDSKRMIQKLKRRR